MYSFETLFLKFIVFIINDYRRHREHGRLFQELGFLTIGTGVRLMPARRPKWVP